MITFLLYHTPLFYLVQSLWRDEAFSYFMARPNLFSIVQNTAHDFNPPLYYIFLHFWILLFGKSDEILRLLSLFFHFGSVYIGYLFAKKIFSKQFAVFVALFTFFNPMLLYYGFEMRMYSLYACATFASIYFFYTRSWKKYIFATIVGLYSHSFFPLVLISYLLMYRFIPKMKKGDILKIFIPLFFYIPWLFILIGQFLRSSNSWLFPVDFQLIKSVLGNLFTSYEGTPGGMWGVTSYISYVLIGFFIFLLIRQKKKALVFLTPLFVPLILILSYSVLKRPLYVNRYLIFVTVYEILSVSYAIWSIKNKKVKKIIFISCILFSIGFNVFIAPYKKKTDFKATIREINLVASKQDYVFAKTPIGFLETVYYYKDESKVYVYNPNAVAIPDYIGSNVVFPHSSKSSFPLAPSRTFLIDDNAQYELLIRQ